MRLSTFDAFIAFGKMSERAMGAWLRRLAAQTERNITETLAQVPEHRMSPTAREFTLQLLCVNQKRLLDRGPQ